MKNKKNSKSSNWSFWLTVGLIAQLMIAPNPTILKAQTDILDPLLLNVLRSAFAAAVSIPFILINLRKWTRQSLIYSIGAGLCMSVATNALVFALSQGDASYAVVLSLLSPLVLIFLSRAFFHDKITKRGIAGITLAALGGFIVIALPLVFSGKSVSFHVYPMATALMLLNAIFFPLSVILLRKSHEAGAALTATQGVSSIVVLATTVAAYYAIGGTFSHLETISPLSWVGLAYSGIFVIFIARGLVTRSYEHVGAIATSALTYLESLVAIIIPVVILGEHLSAPIAVGGALILFGVYLAEHRQTKRHIYAHSTHH